MMDKIIQKTLCHIAPVVADFNFGCEEISIAYQYNSFGTCFADDRPYVELYSVLIHLNAPLGTEISAEKGEIKKSLFQAGFSYPTCINASDKDTQHYVFECEYTDGLEDEDL